MESHYIEGAEGRLHYLSYSWDTQDRTALVFLSGMTCHAHYWDEIAPAFTGDYAVYSLDWRGHGNSEAASAYTYKGYLSDLTHLLAHLSPGKLVLVGHSLGGYVALLYASQTEPRSPLAAVVACDVKTGSTEQEHEGGRRATAKPQASYASLEELAARLKAGMPDGSASESRLLELARWGSRRNPGGSYSLKFDRKVLDFEPVNPFAFAGKVRAPTLVINGESSIVMSRAQAQELAAAVPGARHVELAGAGHHAFLDKPADFVAAVRAFLREIGPA